MTNQNSFQHKQTGAALLVALIMLLISTMIGLASIRGTTLNEKMSSNMYDRSLSYQAAESALRAAEARLESDQSSGVVDCTDINVRCPPTPASTFENETAGWTTVADSYLVNDELLASKPQYYIERMGEVGGTDELDLASSANCANYAGCDQTPPLAAQFRITARSGIPDDDGRSVVALQITVKQNL